MSQASDVELLMLNLINEERTSRGLGPLEINNDLNEAAENHSQWMLDEDVFSHTGAGGSSSNQRIADSDYSLEGNWRTAENIGWQSERGEAGIADDVADIHESLMNSPGHRANILNPDLEDIGIGIERGDFAANGNVFDGVMITQNFGRTDAVVTPPDDDILSPPVADIPAVVETPTEPEIVDVTPSVAEPAVSIDPPGTTPEPNMNEVDPPQMDDFEFVDMPIVDDVSIPDSPLHFIGMVTTSNGIITTNDISEFEAILLDVWSDFADFFSECWDLA